MVKTFELRRQRPRKVYGADYDFTDSWGEELNFVGTGPLALRGVHVAKDRADLLRSWAGKLNQEMKKKKSLGRIDIGADIKFLDPERIRTGILGLDVVTSGGIPRGGMVTFWGPYSSGKTTSAIHCGVACQQNEEGTIAIAAAEGFDKSWARENGLLIPYSEEELDELHAEDPELATFAEEEQEDWPDVVVLQHTHGDALLEMTYEAVRSNLFDMVIVDSLAAMQRHGDTEDKSLEDQAYGGQAGLFSHFTKKMYSAFSRRYDSETMQEKSDGDLGNRTAVICINQARVKIGARSMGGNDVHKPTGGEALKHAWLSSIHFRQGPRLETKEGKHKRPYASTVRVRCDKSKIGTPFREAEWVLYTDHYEDFGKGDIDLGQELVLWGEYFGILEKSGSWYSYNGDQLGQGGVNAGAALMEDEDLVEELYEEIVQASRK